MKNLLFLVAVLNAKSYAQEKKLKPLSCHQTANELSCETQVIAPFVINTDAPWEITFADAGKKKSILKLEKFQFAQTTVKVTLQSNTQSYRLVGYICTSDKKKCFREIIEGSVKS